MRERKRRRAPAAVIPEVLGTAAHAVSFTWPRPGEGVGDLPLINASARELNAEAEDALSYQLLETDQLPDIG